MRNKIKGLLLTSTISLFIVFVFFGDIVYSPNSYYFSEGGDGFKAYYGAIYHLEHDTSTMRMEGMNYPYGEMVFFTGSQPLVVNLVKFISNNFIDISSHIVGIINLLMLFSIVFAALFLFLIFHELKVNWIYASVVAVGICMLSPQIARFGGHFSLSWVFWIPLMLYLIIRFDKTPSFINTIFIGIVTFLAGGMHMYFYAFYGFIIGGYLFAQVFNAKRKFGFAKGLGFFVVQYILPFLIFQAIISANDTVIDRTIFPYGFWAFMAHPAGIFLPGGKPYAFVPEVITVLRHVSWESRAFIGVSALAGFALGLGVFFVKMFTKRNPLKVSGNYLLNVLFWCSFLALLFSFGLPFKFGLNDFVDKIGPLRQLRALARFSWLFFYVLNIVVFFNMYQKWQKTTIFSKWGVLNIVAVGFLLFDGGWNTLLNSRFIHNKKPIITDVENKLPENEWVNEINFDDFQAILPLPYFHVGSENIWVESKTNTQELAMMVSLKTGLPTTGVQLSRTSISQTYKNYALVTEPFEPFKILSDLRNQKPFLLLINRKSYFNEDEQRLIKIAKLIYQNEKIELRELPLQELSRMNGKYFLEARSNFRNSKLFKKEQYLVSDSNTVFIHKTFNDLTVENTYEGRGAFQYQGDDWALVLKDTLRLQKGDKYKLSFWMSDYGKDGNLRAILEFVQRNPQTQKVENYFYSDAHRHIKGFHGNWALIEAEFEAKSDNELISMAIRNSILKGKKMILDELIIRQKNVDIYYPLGNVQFKNGRKLPLKQIEL